jgi:hypothetical protein
MEFKRYILILILAVFFKTGLIGQSDKVEALRVSFITDKIKLTPAEGQSFWPLYNEYNDKVKSLRKSFRQQYGATADFKTDKDAEDFLNAELKLRQNEVDLQKEYIEKFKKVLGAKKTAMLRKAEEEFKREIIKTIKGNGNDS